MNFSYPTNIAERFARDMFAIASGPTFLHVHHVAHHSLEHDLAHDVRIRLFFWSNLCNFRLQDHIFHVQDPVLTPVYHMVHRGPDAHPVAEGKCANMLWSQREH